MEIAQVIIIGTDAFSTKVTFKVETLLQNASAKLFFL
jgi:hypothetical protein